MIRYLRAIALAHSAVALIFVALLGYVHPTGLYHQVLYSTGSGPLLIVVGPLIGLSLVADAILSCLKPDFMQKYLDKYRYIPLLSAALFFSCLSLFASDLPAVSMQFTMEFLLVMALLINDALYHNHKRGGTCPLHTREKVPLRLKMFFLAIVTAALMSYPILARARDFDSEVGAIVDGAKVAVTLISFLGASVRTVLRLYNDTIKIERPLLELLVNVLVGTLCGWGFYLVADNNMDTASLIGGILLSSILPTFFLDKLAGSHFLHSLHRPTSLPKEQQDEQRDTTNEGR